MTPLDALRDVRGYAAANRVALSDHAWQPVREGRGSYEEVRCALVHAESCIPKDGDTWEVLGPDFGDEDLTVIEVIDDGVVVVTFFGPR